MANVPKSLSEELVEHVSSILTKNEQNLEQVDSVRAEVRNVIDSVLQRSEDNNLATERREKLTPPKLAESWGISPDKVLSWIRSGELRAVNVATDRRSRPRYLIDAQAIEEFELARSIEPVRATTRRKPNRDDGITEYF